MDCGSSRQYYACRRGKRPARVLESLKLLCYDCPMERRQPLKGEEGNPMHYPTLIVRLFSVLFIIGAAFPAHAQQSSGNTGSGFCALAGTDLLSALDGSWTIQQGAGLAAGQHNGRAITIPLPPPPVASVNFTYDAQQRVIDVESADLAEKMIMFPSAPAQQNQASQLLGAQTAGNAAASGSGCDWYSLPIMIGTNHYVSKSVNYVHYYSNHAANCAPGATGWGLGGTFYSAEFDKNMTMEEYCTSTPPGRFDMEMTIVLRFTNSQSGSGSVHYTGKQDGVNFAASARVTLTR